MPNKPPVTNVADPRWLRAVSHPIRVRLLAMLEEEPSSPVILASKLEQPLGTIAYHVRTLYDLGLLKLVRTRQRRGATEHYYQALDHPGMSGEDWTALDGVSKQRLLTAQLTRAHDYATRSAAAGGFDRADAALSTSSLKLDEQGWTELAAAAEGWLAQSREIERAAAERLEQAPGSAIDVGMTVQLFEALPFSAPLPSTADGIEADSADGHSGAGTRGRGAASSSVSRRGDSARRHTQTRRAR